jgi:hypothetical protein
MNLDPQLRSACRVQVPPPQRLAIATEQRCLAVLNAEQPRPVRIPRWEWLVYAASMAICSGYVVQTTFDRLSAPVNYAMLDAKQ